MYPPHATQCGSTPGRDDRTCRLGTVKRIAAVIAILSGFMMGAASAAVIIPTHIAAQRNLVASSAAATSTSISSSLASQAAQGISLMFWGTTCHPANPGSTTTVSPCIYGQISASTTIDVFGDSFAQMLVPALNQIGTMYHVKFVVLSRTGCSAFAAPVANQNDAGCDAWRANAVAYIKSSAPFAVIVDSIIRWPLMPNGTGYTWPAWRNYVAATMSAFPASILPILLTGTPGATLDPSSCVPLHASKVSLCNTAVSAAYTPFMAQSISAATTAGAAVINVQSLLCTATTCPAVINGMLVHAEAQHLSSAMSAAMGPAIGDALGCVGLLAPMATGGAPALRQVGSQIGVTESATTCRASGLVTVPTNIR